MPPSQQAVFPDEDSNLPSQERIKLLERLQISLGDVPPHFWAACHLCGLSELELLVQTAELNSNVILLVAAQTYNMVANWNQSISTSAATTPRSSPTLRRHQFSTSGPSSSPLRGLPEEANTPPSKKQKTSFARSQSARDKAERRDNSRCVLTGMSIIEVAHIYPFCLLVKEDEIFGKRHIFWRMLRNFWPQETIKTWEAALFPNGTEQNGIETPRNLITLSRDAHGLWSKGSFALKPVSVSDDNKTLTIQFFWQVKQALVMPTINLTTIPLSTANLESNNGNLLFVVKELRNIKSGDLFVLKTDDVEARPLPSMALLEMQWFLQRVMGMAGAVDEFRCPEFDEDEDEISNLGLDEAGDESFLSSDVPGMSDPIIPNNTSGLASAETPKQDMTEEMEDILRDRAVM